MSEPCNPKTCAYCREHFQGMFSTLPEELLQLVDSQKGSRTFQEGELLFTAGDDATHMHCIRKGIVAIEAPLPCGSGRILRVRSSGDLLGYRAILSGRPYDVTARAKTLTEVCTITKATLLKVIDDQPRFAFKLLDKAASDVQAGDARWVSFNEKSAKSRVAETLIRLQNWNAELHWTRREIAAWASTTPETVMRTLSQWQAKGLLSKRGRRIIVNKPELLEKEAGPISRNDLG